MFSPEADVYPKAPIEMSRHFHTVVRELYSILVFELERDPNVSLKIIALWIWMEQTDFKNVMPKILSLPISSINELAAEALVCFRCIADPLYAFSSNESEISQTQHLMGNLLSIMYFHENRAKATYEIQKIIDTVCLNALKDLAKMALKKNTEQLIENKKLIPPPILQAMNLKIPSFGQFGLTTGESSRSVVRFSGMTIPKDNRTMFVTFSRGYPVSEGELRELFNDMFGDNYVESITMQIVKKNEHPLFAIIVFFTPNIIDLILNDKEKAKYAINGKQVWMRKFIPKYKKYHRVI